jgi:hypothetical protein
MRPRFASIGSVALVASALAAACGTATTGESDPGGMVASPETTLSPDAASRAAPPAPAATGREGFAPGDRLPEVALATIEGDDWKSSDHRGKVLLLNFFGWG